MPAIRISHTSVKCGSRGSHLQFRKHLRLGEMLQRSKIQDSFIKHLQHFSSCQYYGMVRVSLRNVSIQSTGSEWSYDVGHKDEGIESPPFVGADDISDITWYCPPAKYNQATNIGAYLRDLLHSHNTRVFVYQIDFIEPMPICFSIAVKVTTGNQ